MQKGIRQLQQQMFTIRNFVEICSVRTEKKVVKAFQPWFMARNSEEKIDIKL